MVPPITCPVMGMLHFELLGKALGFALLLVLVNAIQRRYFHSLSKYPGPWLASVSHFWEVILRMTLIHVLMTATGVFSTFSQGHITLTIKDFTIDTVL